MHSVRSEFGYKPLAGFTRQSTCPTTPMGFCHPVVIRYYGFSPCCLQDMLSRCSVKGVWLWLVLYVSLIFLPINHTPRSGMGFYFTRLFVYSMATHLQPACRLSHHFKNRPVSDDSRCFRPAQYHHNIDIIASYYTSPWPNSVPGLHLPPQASEPTFAADMRFIKCSIISASPKRRLTSIYPENLAAFWFDFCLLVSSTSSSPSTRSV